MGMGVEIADGKLLHVGKKIFPDTAHGPLPHLYHQTVVSESGERTRRVDHRHGAERPEQRSEIRIRRLCHWNDIVVDQSPEEQRSFYVGHRCCRNEKDHRQ